VGRVDVGARGGGIAQRALSLRSRISQQREPFDRQIAKHQAIQFRLADMATKARLRLMTLKAGHADAGQR
jgi:alkylation response protein AidB-like acyl-CoA dehydrogenase